MRLNTTKENKMKTKAIGTILLALGLAAHSTVVLAEKGLNLDFDLTYSSDDNLNKSPDDALAVDDSSITATLSAGLSSKINLNSLVNLGAAASFSQFQDTDGMDNAAMKLSAAYLYKPTGGFGTPLYILSTDIIFSDSRTDIRDQTSVKVGATFSKRITTTFSTKTGISATTSESDSKVFDTKNSRFFINADLSFSKRATAYLTYSFISGDSVSTLSLNNPSDETLEVINISTVIAPDPTFDSNQIAYQLDTKTSVISLGFNYIVAPKHALDISTSIITSDADSYITYDRTIISLSYLASF